MLGRSVGEAGRHTDACARTSGIKSTSWLWLYCASRRQSEQTQTQTQTPSAHIAHDGAHKHTKPLSAHASASKQVFLLLYSHLLADSL